MRLTISFATQNPSKQAKCSKFHPLSLCRNKAQTDRPTGGCWKSSEELVDAICGFCSSSTGDQERERKGDNSERARSSEKARASERVRAFLSLAAFHHRRLMGRASGRPTCWLLILWRRCDSATHPKHTYTHKRLSLCLRSSWFGARDKLLRDGLLETSLRPFINKHNFLPLRANSRQNFALLIECRSRTWGN